MIANLFINYQKILKNKFMKNLIQFSLFSAYGLFANILSFFFYFLLVEVMNQNYILSSIFVASTFITINFFIYLKIFKVLKTFNKLIKYFFTQLIFFLFHILLMIFLVEYLSISAIYSHLISNIFLAIIIFFVYKFYIFILKNEK